MNSSVWNNSCKFNFQNYNEVRSLRNENKTYQRFNS